MASLSQLLRRVRDPVSGFTHLAGAFVGALGIFYLLQLTLPSQDPRRIISGLVFGISLVLLYLSSAAYHLLNVSEEWTLRLRRADHALIFTLIAGSYTPYCLVTLRDSWGTPLLATVWGIAVVGLALSIFWIHAPRWLSTALYLFMGWFVVVAISPLHRALSREAMGWLVGGGASYTLGAFVYGLKRPDPFPPHFGHHEIWHLLVLAGSICHYISVCYVLG